ncbi:MAG TPA: hypothetical protein VKV39_05530 [Candidatus Sulfotelmatobacter sp.]|nr:hypothetical protein [Candidatus Sulfotelmatobacter sp.]
MANFEGFPSGHDISGRTLPVIRNTVSVGLDGYLDFDSKELDVVAVDSWDPTRELPGVTLQPGKIVGGDTRIWNVTSSVSQTVRLEARSKGSTWTWVEFVFTVPPNSPGNDTDRAAVLAAVQSGQIVGATQQLTAVCNKGYMEVNDITITLSGPMLRVLATLAKSAKLTLLSLMRYNEGPHGKVQPDGTAICTAMDIQQFGQFPINLINGDNVDNTIKGISAVIGALPGGLYALGLTRPSVRAQGPPMPNKDVFLPVKTSADIYKVGFPLSNPTPQFRDPNAAKAINDALTQNPAARMNRMFQDGPDHLHLEVIQ